MAIRSFSNAARFYRQYFKSRLQKMTRHIGYCDEDDRGPAGLLMTTEERVNQMSSVPYVTQVMQDGDVTRDAQFDIVIIDFMIKFARSLGI
jgi:predicted enzyme related to lactoylglutathione lyase